jgi:hypothetical protein
VNAAQPGLLHAIAQGAAEATGAASVTLVGRRDDELRVLAAGGDDPAHAVGDEVPPGNESLGFVLASGQTLALGPRLEPSSESKGVHRTPSATLCVPCLGTEGVLGALELLGRPGVTSFEPEATRLATVFAEIAAAALLAGGLGVEAGPSHGELAAELARLQDTDPARYAAIASVLGALLAHG